MARREQRRRAAAINNLPVSEIDTALALKVLEPIWKNTPETASRVRQRCEQVIAWAAARDYREKRSSPNFAWRGHLDKLLPKPVQDEAASSTTRRFHTAEMPALHG